MLPAAVEGEGPMIVVLTAGLGVGEFSVEFVRLGDT